MKIIVTGGAGFIGSNLVDALITNGHEVLVIDNLSSGFKKFINSKAQFEQVDIQDKKIVNIFDNFNPDLVYHLAAQKVVQVSLDNPLFDAQINIMGTLNLLSVCQKNNINKIIFASSAAVYEEKQPQPLTENSIVKPISPYGIAKLAVDLYLDFYYQYYKLSYISLRFANAYGPRQDPQGEAGVISLFFDQLLNNKPIVIYGDGQQTRDFIYVDDIVDALLTASTTEKVGLYNIGTGKETTVNDLFNKQKFVVGSKAESVYKPIRTGEIIRSVFDSTKAKEDLSWMPKIDIDQGLVKFYQYLIN